MNLNNFDCEFPIKPFERMINYFGWESVCEWIKFWETNKLSDFKNNISSKYKNDWILGLLLPLLTSAFHLKKSSTERKIIGLSALPGTGKSSLGKLIKELSKYIDLNIAVISIDDFYLPFQDRKKIIKENPWGVSRGFPGTHSTELMLEKVLQWKASGMLNVPIFDKSLQNGLGDRSHWIKDEPDLIILEGWFLCVEPQALYKSEDNSFSPALRSSEISYRSQIQQNLRSYTEIWKLIDKVWHLKPREFEHMEKWKIQQENELLRMKGSALADQKLFDFLRMLSTSIPQKSFDEIKSDFLVLLNQDRKLNWVGLSEDFI